MTLRVLQAGLVLTEVPITFVERELGASKMSNTVIIEAFTRVAQWGITARLHGHSAALRVRVEVARVEVAPTQAACVKPRRACALPGFVRLAR